MRRMKFGYQMGANNIITVTMYVIIHQHCTNGILVPVIVIGMDAVAPPHVKYKTFEATHPNHRLNNISTSQQVPYN
jgi:hypothetical protein